jgi:hypothetical protein
MATETASHILCECVTSAELKFHHLGKSFTEPNNYDEIPLCKILYFVRGMGLLADIHAQLIKKWLWYKGCLVCPHHLYSHFLSGHDCFLPHLLQVIIHSSSCHLMLHSLNY